MDQTMVERWNSVVKPGDKVYHLGDVFFGSKDSFKKLWPKLNGSKRLIVGNHEDITFMSSGGFFQKVQLWRVFREWNITMSHAPMHYDTFYNYKLDKPTLNVHGHIHQNPSPPGPYHCVCVEQTNYTPVHIEELAASANKL